MSNILQSKSSYFSDIHVFKANSIYLNKIYAKKEKERKKKNPNFLWNPIEIQNILKPLEKNSESVRSIQKPISKLTSRESSSVNSNNSEESYKFQQKTISRSISRESSSFKSNKPEENTETKNKISSNAKKTKIVNLKKIGKTSQESFANLNELFDDGNLIEKISQNKNNDKEKDSFSLINKTIDSFEKTLQDFLEERKKPKKLTNRSSSKSLENLKNLQKSLSQIEEDMDKKLKIMQPKKSTTQLLAENIENQQTFTTNDDIYEISFQQKN